VLRLPAGSDSWTALPSAGKQGLMAIDGAGNVYVITGDDTGGVMRLAAGSTTWTQLPGPSAGFREPGGWRWTPVGTYTSPTISVIRGTTPVRV
jgi:hypothetical protein